MRMKRSMTLVERLRLRVLVTPGCHVWQGRVNPKGYGLIDAPRVPGEKGRPLLAHRVAWELTNGPIPYGLAICHRCDNPPCCLVDHMFLGTRADNNADMLAKGRTARGEAKRQKLTRQDVAEIRRLWESGGVKQKDLVTRFGVSAGVISQIISRQLWR